MLDGADEDATDDSAEEAAELPVELLTELVTEAVLSAVLSAVLDSSSDEIASDVKTPDPCDSLPELSEMLAGSVILSLHEVNRVVMNREAINRTKVFLAIFPLRVNFK